MLDEARTQLYVLNKFDATISVVSTASQSEVARVRFFDPSPTALKRGRKHLYDTHKNSGLGHVACASCHVDAVFRGTPRLCAGCHTAGSRVSATARPASHVVSSASCGQCHSTSAWTPARYDHAEAIGSCVNCHNGTQATGKGATHVSSTTACDACHATTRWEPVRRVDHAEGLEDLRAQEGLEGLARDDGDERAEDVGRDAVEELRPRRATSRRRKSATAAT